MVFVEEPLHWHYPGLPNVLQKKEKAKEKLQLFSGFILLLVIHTKLPWHPVSAWPGISNLDILWLSEDNICDTYGSAPNYTVHCSKDSILVQFKECSE